MSQRRSVPSAIFIHGVVEVMMAPVQSAGFSFLILTILCIVTPYLLGVRPETRRQWTLIAITIAFLTWVLPFMAPLRSR